MVKTGKQKDGRPLDREKQNGQARAAAVRMKLDRAQRRALKLEIEARSRGLGMDLGYEDVLELAREIAEEGRGA